MSLWYVDNAATGSNNGTSWTNAWDGFNHIVWGGAGVVAGDTLYISGGVAGSSKTYTEADGDNGLYSILWIQADGTSIAPITISVGLDTGHTGIVIIDATVTYTSAFLFQTTGNYVNLYGGGSNPRLRVINCKGQAVKLRTVGNVNINGLDVPDALGNGMWMGDVDDIDIAYLHYQTKVTTGALSEGQDGVYAQASPGTSSDIVLHHSTFENRNNDVDYHYDFCQITGTSNPIVHHCYGFGNGCEDGTQGFYFKNCTGDVTLYDNVSIIPNGSHEIFLDNAAVAARLVAYNNTVVAGGGAASTFCIYDLLGSEQDHIIQNNIIVWYSATSAGRPLYISNYIGTAANIDYNCYLDNYDTSIFNLNGVLHTFAQWQTDGYDAHGVNADPLLANIDAGNFLLKTGSPCINTGVTIGAVTDDYYGIARPVGAAYDMGAYEWNPGPWVMIYG